MTAPPHIMIIMPGTIDQTVFSPDYHSGAPWIMYAGTPYEHIMMSVTDGVMKDMVAMAPATPSA